MTERGNPRPEVTPWRPSHGCSRARVGFPTRGVDTAERDARGGATEAEGRRRTTRYRVLSVSQTVASAGARADSRDSHHKSNVAVFFCLWEKVYWGKKNVTKPFHVTKEPEKVMHVQRFCSRRQRRANAHTKVHRNLSRPRVRPPHVYPPFVLSSKLTLLYAEPATSGSWLPSLVPGVKEVPAPTAVNPSRTFAGVTLW